jgi:capsule polysaccharide export protein KpsE/RkpR
MSERIDPIIEQAANGWEAINKLADERRALQEELKFARERINQLEAQLDHAERGLTHYRNRYEWFQRFSAEIVANFSTIRMIVDDTQKKASAVAQGQEQPTPLPAVEPALPTVEPEQTRLKDLAAHLEG